MVEGRGGTRKARGWRKGEGDGLGRIWDEQDIKGEKVLVYRKKKKENEPRSFVRVASGWGPRNGGEIST